MLYALRNNALWVVFFTGVVVTLGLLIAVLTDRVRYEAVARGVVFLPMAVSLVAAGVIWKFMYDYRPPGLPQTGTVNAAFNATVPAYTPHPWLIQQPWNNVALIIAAAWIWTGFATVILAAGLKGVPADVLEAARVDGASEWQTFRRVALPLAKPIVALVFFFSFAADWNNFFLPFAVLADSSQYPIQVGLSDLLSSTPSFNPAQGGGGQQVNIFRPELALATLLAVVPVAIVFLLSQRALVRGMLGGAVKQ